MFSSQEVVNFEKLLLSGEGLLDRIHVVSFVPTFHIIISLDLTLDIIVWLRFG